MVSNRERISHVVRRLGFGPRPDLVAGFDDIDAAVAGMIDISQAAATPPVIAPPDDIEAGQTQGSVDDGVRFWFEQLISSDTPLLERMVWFWHDHFATSVRKVKFPYLMWIQHLTLRRHATGSFADLLYAIAIDPAMLIYLDGTRNARDQINENFGREVMELFTMGRGSYTEDDVVASARAFSGWVVNLPGRRFTEALGDPWTAVFVPRRHDNDSKTLLGISGGHDAAAAVEILLDQPATAEYVGGKLFADLVGRRPDPAETRRIAAAFRNRYQVMDLIGAIVAEPAFLADDAVFARVRTPLERGVGLVQAFGVSRRGPEVIGRVLRNLDFVPWQPPNVAGYPDGGRLLDPSRMAHGFDLMGVVDRNLPDLSATEVMTSLGIHDVSDPTFTTLEKVREPTARIALATSSPEYVLT
ncbi:MAG: DUF1800 domain-containing protein [Acidimicrobiia bacterium]|nr:DUF1800 domain-containing protein [Acidimicrobiia bacterium]